MFPKERQAYAWRSFFYNNKGAGHKADSLAGNSLIYFLLIDSHRLFISGLTISSLLENGT